MSALGLVLVLLAVCPQPGEMNIQPLAVILTVRHSKPLTDITVRGVSSRVASRRDV